MKQEISQLKNIGDLLNITESTLEEADKTISTAKKVMDSRIKKMEELFEKYDEILPELEHHAGKTNSKNIKHHDELIKKIPPETEPSRITDPDLEDRAYIARRNRKIILMLEENVPLEEIARQTGASLREIQMIKKFIK